MTAFELKREEAIQNSRELINLSKRIIYATHREDMKDAARLVAEIKKAYQKLLALCNIPLDMNMNLVAYQEYVEAICFYEFEKSGNIPTQKSLGVDTESYLLGLCDLTGELVRYAVNSVIAKKFKKAMQIKDVVEEIYGEFLQFNLRNGELRKKSDQIKWNLRKLEDIALDYSLKGRTNA